MTKLSIAICHVGKSPDRRMYVRDMVARLGGMETIRKRLAGFDVFDDFGPEKGGGLWPNHKRSWAAGLRYPSTHHIVFEDDVELCPDFLDLAEAALDAAGERLVTFYATRGIIDDIRTFENSSWLPVKDGAWGPALCIPTPWVGEFLAWDRDNLKQDPDVWLYDARLLLWAMSTDPDGRKPSPRWWWATTPSLVQHRAPSASLIGYSNSKRVATWYRGNDQKPIDWTKGLDDPPYKDTGGFPPWDPHWNEVPGAPIWRREQPWMIEKGWKVG